jgi:hypothetical protein
MVLSTCSQNHTISGNTKEYIHVRYISPNTVPLCKYTLLPATVQVLKSLLKAIFWKPLQLYIGMLNNVSSITIAPSFQCWFHSRGRVKSNFCVVTLFFAKKSLTKTERFCWSIVMKENPVGFPIYGAFPFDRIPKATKDVNVYSCNYTGELRKIFEAITYLNLD